MPYTIRAAVEGLPTVQLQTADTPLPGDQSQLPYVLGALLAKALLASGVPPTNLFAEGVLRLRLDLVRDEDMGKPRPVIRRASASGTSKKGQLRSSLTAREIQLMLGGLTPESGGDDKTNYEFHFTVDGVKCGVWDWHGTSWSTFGPREALVKVFGEENVL